MGGRAKGTPNKPPKPLNEWTETMLKRYRPRMEMGLESASQETFVLAYAALTIAASIINSKSAKVTE